MRFTFYNIHMCISIKTLIQKIIFQYQYFLKHYDICRGSVIEFCSSTCNIQKVLQYCMNTLYFYLSFVYLFTFIIAVYLVSTKAIFIIQVQVYMYHCQLKTEWYLARDALSCAFSPLWFSKKKGAWCAYNVQVHVHVHVHVYPLCLLAHFQSYGRIQNRRENSFKKGEGKEQQKKTKPQLEIEMSPKKWHY